MSGPVPEPEDVEEVDAVPVLASDGATLAAQRSQGAVVVKQAAAVAVGSFAAGDGHRRRGADGEVRRLAPALAQAPAVVASRSFLVDVHLLGDKR